jgi:hypothetical protein
MRFTHLRYASLAATCALVVATGLAQDDFKPLVNGTDIHQFELVKIDTETMRIDDGVIIVSGKPNGYFATKDTYHNYVIRFDWMYDRPDGLSSDADFKGNSGLLVHIQPPHKVWPQCIEVQLAYKEAGAIFGIFGSKFLAKKDPDAQKRAMKPVGQWNQEEVTCQDGSIVCKLNGIEVCRGTGASPDQGFIGLQSEGSPIRFRNLTIKRLD